MTSSAAYRTTLALVASFVGFISAPITCFAQDQAPGKGDRILQNTTLSPTTAPSLLPNGATSISETYGDWTVACTVDNREKRCVFSQSQGDNQTGQRVFAIELQAPQNDSTDGMVLLPFGLKLDDGIRLKIDDQDLGHPVRFSTCYIQGCIVPLTFPKVATDALMKGTNLVISATDSSAGEKPTFKVSLNGFSAAIKRARELAD